MFGLKGPSGFSTAEEVTDGIDGSGLTAIVTGATSGIGTETARVLALRGVHVVMAIRNMSAGKDVKEAILKQNPSAKIDAMELDVSSIASVNNFASDYKSSGLPLNILINNAGILATPFLLSKDNIELQFATNHVGHFHLTNLLLETMKRTADESNKEGRILNVSSRRHQLSYSEGIRFDEINSQSGYDALSAYGQSKLANVLHTNELARLLKEDGTKITANSVNPGAIPTNIFRHYALFSSLVNIFGKLVLKNVQQGAATTCYAALHPQVEGISGKYFTNCNLATTSSQANDAQLGKILWDYTANLIKEKSSVS
ncbi:short-chain dehydrogenase TIC 32, chloroplastic-like [Rutidosis leptorrhynchoides]|uniref:short-chain dehydrogenase TIC 32, chloroplastic-like n=1 Tax=Rutidosis leptorrhynchoides TaxID=125765 RepID=UPI003A98FFA5